MDATLVKTAFDELEERLKLLKVETARIGGEDDQIGDTLRALLPVTEAGDMVLMEVMVTPFDEGMALLHLYTTLIMEIGPGYEALKEMVLDWNLLCPLGAFGIFRQERQFYHKYVFPFPKNLPPKKLADRVMYLLEVLYEVISQRFDEAVQLSGHE